MKLIGNTKIELTDVYTGEVEPLEETNMVTEALNNFYNCNPMGIFYRLEKSSSAKYFDKFFVPICPNILGGILLFSEPLEERTDNILVGSDQLPIAYASNNANPFEDSRRGSFNLNESMPITDGYRFVWDFSTSQGNGTIASLGLTSNYGGASVYGNQYEDASTFCRLCEDSIAFLPTEKRQRYMEAVELDFETEILTSIEYKDDAIHIYKGRIQINSLGLNDRLNGESYTLLETHTIHPEIFTLVKSVYYYGVFLDGLDGYWYGFSNKGNNTGTATMYWIKIKKEDYSFTEGKWTFTSTPLNQCGKFELDDLDRFNGSCVRNGYLYIHSFSRKQIFKINVENSADITKYDLGFSSSDLGVGSSSGNGTMMLLIKDMIIGRDFIIYPDDRIERLTGDEKIEHLSTPVFLWKQFLITYSATYRTVTLLTPFLATINNLSSAVEKTADKTMKITYTLNEVSD